jgi:two-component system, LytTR family, sensor kinase
MLINSVYQFLNKRPIVHLMFWTLFVLIGSFLFSYQQNFPYFFFLINFLVHLPVFILFTYGLVYFLVPTFLLNQRYWQFFLSLLVFVVVATLMRIFIGRYIYYALFIPEILHPAEWLNIDIFLVNLIWVLAPAILFSMFKYYKNWTRSQALANETERKHLAAELQVLKAQLNPHFLFNTFNNLYVLALQKSDKTPVVISKISDLFYYIIYECNAVEVPVSKEIKLIEDYILLEKLRYTNRLSVIFEKDIDSAEYRVPPMLLYSFVENCFKHGSSPDPTTPWIMLVIRVRKNKLEFEASNSIPSANCLNDQIIEGVGLSNIKRRLELIYPNNHQLIIRKENCEFFVKLIIQKNSTDITELNA